MKHFLPLFIAISSFLSTGFSAYANGATQGIVGSVSIIYQNHFPVVCADLPCPIPTAYSKPIAGVRVHAILRRKVSKSFVTVTNQSGLFSLNTLPAGEYLVVGYAGARKIVTVRHNKLIKVNFTSTSAIY